MNHPNSEQWISYLYGEISPRERAELQAHAEICPECQAQLDSWIAAKTKLNDWALPGHSRSPVVLRHAVKWGIAAMLMIGFGFGLAWFTAPKFDSAKLEENLRAQFAQQLNTAREADKTQIAALLAKMEQDRAVDYANLRADLETVAITADATLRRTQRQIGELTLIAQNGNDSSEPNKN